MPSLAPRVEAQETTSSFRRNGDVKENSFANAPGAQDCQKPTQASANKRLWRLLQPGKGENRQKCGDTYLDGTGKVCPARQAQQWRDQMPILSHRFGYGRRYGYDFS